MSRWMCSWRRLGNFWRLLGSWTGYWLETSSGTSFPGSPAAECTAKAWLCRQRLDSPLSLLWGPDTSSSSILSLASWCRQRNKIHPLIFSSVLQNANNYQNASIIFYTYILIHLLIDSSSIKFSQQDCLKTFLPSLSASKLSVLPALLYESLFDPSLL